MYGKKFLRQWLWHSLLKLCTKNYENLSIFVKVTAKKSVAPFFLDMVYMYNSIHIDSKYLVQCLQNERKLAARQALWVAANHFGGCQTALTQAASLHDRISGQSLAYSQNNVTIYTCQTGPYQHHKSRKDIIWHFWQEWQRRALQSRGRLTGRMTSLLLLLQRYHCQLAWHTSYHLTLITTQYDTTINNNNKN